jgi:2'-5' RNA ligase
MKSVRMAKRGPIHQHENSPHSRLQARYDLMWSESIGDLQNGNVEIDPVLAASLPDERRGLTVIARPSASVRARVAGFLRELRELEPRQYYYAPSEFHMTVLSLFTATAQHDRFFARIEEYLAAADSALRHVAPIRIEFTGVTVSPGAIMIQGFCDNEDLNEVRDALRRELQGRDLVEGLDVRYRLETAHMTIVRFRAPLRNKPRFTAALEQSRHRDFGAANITAMSLVKNDWYMSRRTLETVKRYRLATH